MGDFVKKDKEMMRGALLALIATGLLAACGEESADDSNPPAAPPSPPVAPAPPPPPPPPQSFAIGGTISGLSGTGLVLQNNAGDDLTISSNGNFTFAGQLSNGATYDVTTRTQPGNPAQLCVVSSGSGTVAAANVTNVAVTCGTPQASSFLIGGTVTGLRGTLVLQNNGGDDLTLAADGPFAFAGTLANGAGYDVRVATQPGTPPQVCTVSNASGIVAGAHVGNVDVSCITFLTVTGTTPADNASGVARNANITIQFSANVDPATINESNITLTSVGGSKRLTFATSAREVVITPAGSFLPAAHYTLTITPAVRGAEGEVLAGAVTRTFRATDGQWGTPRMIGSMGSSALSPRIAFDASGNAVAIWRQAVGQEIKVAAIRYTAGVDWGTPVIIDPDTHLARTAELAVDPNGTAFAVWSDYLGTNNTQTMVSRSTAGTIWSPEIVLGAAAGVGNTQVAVDPAGNAIAVWEEVDSNGGRVAWAMRYAIGQGWDAGIQLGTSSGTTAADPMLPQIALDKDGYAIATYRVKANLIYYDGWSRTYSPGSGWGDPESFETEQSSVSHVPVVFDPNGNAFAFWTQGSANFGHSSIWANRYDANDGWGPALLIESDDIAPGQAVSLAVDASGNAMAVWQHSDLSRARTDIWANRYVAGTGAGAGWQTETRIENQRLDNANSAQVAMDPGGNAIAVWKESDGTRYSMWTNRCVAGGTWGTTAMLLELDNGEVSDPEIAMDADGNAFAIWTQFDGASTNVWVNRFE
jgi:hypothetical protein